MVDPITETGLAAAALARDAGAARPEGRAGEAAANDGADLLQRIRRRFVGDAAAERTLAAALEDPESEAALRGLAASVSSYLAQDPAFLGAVREAVDGAARSAAVPDAWVRAAYIKNVQVMGGPVTVHGDLNFNNNN